MTNPPDSSPDPSSLVWRSLTEADAPAAADLTEIVGWGRDVENFRQVIAWGGAGCFGITRDGTLIATTTTIQYGQQRGWIGMVIVHPDFQGLGLGRRITQQGIDYLRAQGVADILLVASAQGRPVYEKLGFRPLCLMEAWMGDAVPQAVEPVPPLAPVDLPGLIALDAAAFGVERRQVIEDYVRTFPTLAWCDHNSAGRVCGYVLAQSRGAGFAWIGPWYHATPEGAERLLKTALNAVTGCRVRVNVPDTHTVARQIAAAVGLRCTMQTTRMILNESSADAPTREYGTALPAIG